LIRPDEWQTRALIQHTRADYVSGVTDTERERAIESQQCADFKRRILTDIKDNPHVARGIVRIYALAYDPA
jgi:hypothetical protein